MNEPQQFPEPNGKIGDDTRVRSHSTPTPRWVKVSGIIAIVLVMLVVIVMFIGGDHGPGRHMRSNEQRVQQP